MQIWQFLWAWYNLPFSIAILFFLGLSGLQFVGLGQDQEADQDLDMDQDLDLEHDLDLDQDLDLDHDIDLDQDLDLDYELDQDMDTDLDAGAGVGDGISFLSTALSFIGLGKAPLLIVLLLLFMTFGFAGWLLNSLVIWATDAYPGIALAGTLPAALLASVLLTSQTSRFVNRIVPSVSTTAISRRELVGKRAIVINARVGEKYGRIRVRDRSGATLSVFAKVEAGHASIERDQEVVIVEYDPEQNTYTVVSWNDPQTSADL